MTWLNIETTSFSNLFYIAFLNKLYLKFVLRYFRFFGRFVSSIKFAFFSYSFAEKRVNQKVAHARSRKETTQCTNTSRCAYKNRGPLEQNNGASGSASANLRVDMDENTSSPFYVYKYLHYSSWRNGVSGIPLRGSSLNSESNSFVTRVYLDFRLEECVQIL